MMKTLFLHPPSFDGFDGGAGSRYQARREIRSFWYPTWLAQPAALVPDSRLVDAPPAGLGLDDVLPLAGDYELLVMHTSSPSFASDVRVAEAMRDRNPRLLIGLIGAKVAVDPDGSLAASRAIDFVARNEFDFTIKEVADGRPFDEIDGLSYRAASGAITHNRERAILEDMDALPFVTEVYARDLRVEDYFIGYLEHPYISLYTGRGCKSRCTFCLWPQTVGGHRYRVRSVEHVAAEIAFARDAFPQVKEFFFDDDTFTDNLPRAEAIARELGRLDVTWSCNAKANVPRETLKVLKDNGLRLLLVGYESGNQQILHNIKKGMRIDVARRFTRTATTSASRSTAPSSSACPARARRRSRRRFALRPRSIRTPSRSRSPRPTPAPLCTGRRRAGLAGRGPGRPGGRAWCADRAPALPALSEHGNLRFAGDLLPALLLPPGQDRLDHGRDGDQAADDAPPTARGRRVLPVPARPAGGGALKRRLIVTADDFGLDLAVNEAVEQAVTQGILTAASLMVAAPAAADAVERARRLPKLAVGLHLVLVDGTPALPPERVPDLVGPDGRFSTRMVRAGVDFFFRPAVRHQLDAEIHAQFEAFAATGLVLDHADAHRHMHVHPTVAHLLVEIGAEFGLRAVRLPYEPRALLPGEPSTMATRLADAGLGLWTGLLRRKLVRAGLRTNERVFGLAWSGAMTEQRVLALLEALPEGISEIYFHPATRRTPALVAAMPAYRHVEELEALCNPRVRGAIERAGIELTTFGALEPTPASRPDL